MSISWSETLGAWADALLRASWQGGLAILAVWLACRMLPRLPPAARCWLWRLAFLKLLAVFVWVSPISLPAPPAVPAPLVIQQAEVSATTKPTPSLWDIGSGQSPKESTLNADVIAAALLFVAWLTGVCWQCLQMARGYAAAGRLRQTSKAICGETPLAYREELAPRFGLRCPPTLQVIEEGAGPLLLGLLRPTILLPASLLRDADSNHLRRVLAHEMAHVARRDLFWNWLPALGGVLFFFHPLVLLAGREWQLAQELACDERAMQVTGACPSEYGETLVRVMARRRRGSLPQAVGISAAAPHLLKRRLLAMNSFRSVAAGKLRAGAGAVVLLGLLAIPAWRLVAPARADATPLELLKQVRAHYQSLHSFSMRIQHQDSSGLYPGKFTQSLEWREGDRFALRVISPNNKSVPDFYADSKQVISLSPNGTRFVDKGVSVASNTSPGWEVSGGLILSFLQNVGNSNMLFNPPKGITINWVNGPRTEWHGQVVRELTSEIRSDNDKRVGRMSLFVGKPATLAGYEWKVDGKLGLAVYENQQANPPLPPTLGDVPGK